MSQVHFDIEAMRKKHRDLLDAMFDDARRRAPTPGDLRFIDLQVKAYEMVVSASIFCAEAENSGESRMRIGKALGAALGTVQAQFIGSNSNSPDVLFHFESYMHGTLNALLTGEAPAGAVMGERARVTPMQGSRA